MFYCFQISYRLMMTEKKKYIVGFISTIGDWTYGPSNLNYIYSNLRGHIFILLWFLHTHTFLIFVPSNFFEKKIIFQIFLMIQTRFGQKRVLVSAHCLLHFYVHMTPWNLKTKRIFSKNRTTQQKHHLFFSLLYKYILNKVYKIH